MRFWVLWSAYVPVAVNCTVVVGAMDRIGAVTAIDTSGFVTVSVAVLEMLP